MRLQVEVVHDWCGTVSLLECARTFGLSAFGTGVLAACGTGARMLSNEMVMLWASLPGLLVPFTASRSCQDHTLVLERPRGSVARATLGIGRYHCGKFRGSAVLSTMGFTAFPRPGY